MLAHIGMQSNAEYEREQKLRSRRWTTADYERLRSAALALVRTHRSIDGPGNGVISGVDGDAYWKLLGALDRTEA